MKRMIAIALLSTSVLLAHGQESKVELGTNGGVGFSAIIGDNVESGVSLSWAAGMIAQFNFSEVFSLVVNPMFERKGNTTPDIQLRDDQGNILGTTNIVHQLNYLSLPILARLSFGEQAKFFMNVGPYVSFLTSARTRFTEVLPGLGTDGYDVTESFSRIDLGPAFGLGFSVPIAQGLLFETEMRSSLSLFPINSLSNNSGPNFFEGARNLSVNFLFGFKYALPG